MASVYCKCGFVKNNIPDDHIGKRAKCPKCKDGVLVEKDKLATPQSMTMEKKEDNIKSVEKCPKCGNQEILSDTCSKCGIIITKYLNAHQRKEQEPQKVIIKKEKDIGKPPYYLEYCGWGLTIICIFGIIEGVMFLNLNIMIATATIFISLIFLVLFLPPLNLILQEKFKKIYLIIRYLPLAGVFIFLFTFFYVLRIINPPTPSNYSSHSSKKTSWYEGGTLHSATVGEWSNGTYSNKLATAADWAISRPQIKNKVTSSGNMDTLRPFASELLQCVDSAAKSKGSSNMKVSELAAGCIVLKGW